MVFSDSRCKEFTDTFRSIGAYIVFYQGRPIDHLSHVTDPVNKYSAESEYNAAWNAGMDLAHFMILNNELLNKDPYEAPEQAHIVTPDRKAYIWMDKNGKNTKHTKHIDRRMNLVRNGEEWIFHKTVCFEGGIQPVDIGTRNVREYELNNRLRYAMTRLANWKNTCTRGKKGYRRFWRKMFSEWLDWIESRIRLNEFEMFIWV